MSHDVEYIAKVAHEVNRAYCQSFGDMSQPPWEEAPEWQRTSCINGVKHHIAHPETTPEQSHELWLQEKLATGWKHGPVKDVEKKEHPNCVPFSRLSHAEKVKDHLFRAVVKQLA